MPSADYQCIVVFGVRMRRSPADRRWSVCAVAAGLLAAAGTAHGQWVPNHKHYSIHRLGLFQPANTGNAGLQSSWVSFFGPSGIISGTSGRFAGVDTPNGHDAWVWNGSSTVQIGLTGGAYTGSGGYQVSGPAFQNAAGQIAGYSDRFLGESAFNGREVWIWNGSSTVRIGLTGGGGASTPSSSVSMQSESGIVAGTSTRAIGNQSLGQDAWVWSGGSTRQIGLTGGVNTGPDGYQSATPMFLNETGQVAGVSGRYYSGVGGVNGRDAWVWNGSSTVQVGFWGGVYQGSEGLQLSEPKLQFQSGRVVGFSNRYAGVSTEIGVNSWVWDGSSTILIGLTGGEHTGTNAFEYSDVRLSNSAGVLFGVSSRFAGATHNGTDTWIWDGTFTVQVGLTGGPNAGIAGYQSSSPKFLSQSGQAVGTSDRISADRLYNGQDAWVWNGASTVQIGLTGGLYTGSGGFQESTPTRQNEAGHVAGTSRRVAGLDTSNGQDAWIWNGASTVQIGLIGGVHTGSAGFQSSTPTRLNSFGQVAGTSTRIRSVSTSNGTDAWVWNGATTVQVGLTGGVYTGTGGFQSSTPQFQNEAGHVAGISTRITGSSTSNGTDTWFWDGSTTVQIGLTGGVYAGSAGRQFSSITLLSEAGQVVGISNRYSGISTQVGQDVWYFDPLTKLTSPIIGSVRTSNNYAFSAPTLLTDDGFLLGYYTYFVNGAGTGEDRAFVFRPDLGLTDLGAIVAGGLTDAGWRTLSRPQFSDLLNTIVGTGFTIGQSGGQSVFLMVIPSPAVSSLLGLLGLLSASRKRR